MIRNINGFMLLFLVSFFISCKKNEAKEPETLKTIKSAETKEFFSLVKPINKPEEPLYKTIYNDYSISINSNASNQELIFKKGNVEISKVLKFYYENGDIVFKLYKSNLDNLVLLIEGRDYYSSNLGIYYIDNKSNSIIEIDDTLVFRQEDPEKLGVKDLIGKISKERDLLKFNFYLGDKFLYEKKYNIQKKIEQSIKTYGDNWLGNYQTQINKNSNDTNTMHIVSLNIKKDSIIYEIEGYHVSQKYLLKGTEIKNKLKLELIKDLTQFENPQIEKIKDFGAITYDGNKYILACPYIDLNFGYGVKQICILKKG